MAATADGAGVVRPLRIPIIGSEVGRPRPPAWMRRGRTRRSRSARGPRTPPALRWALLAGASAAAAVAAWVLAA